jgi:hypothetical protein
MSPALAKAGFGEADVILNWDEIAGRYAAVSEPVRVLWPGRGPQGAPDAPSEPATLVLRCEGAFALELQHIAPVLIQKVNQHLGWRAIGRIALRQGPLQRLEKVKVKPVRDAAADAEALQRLTSMQASDLRDALSRLGGAVIARQRAKA